MNKIIKKAAAIVTALAVVVTAAVFDIPEKTTAEAAVTPTVSVSLGTLKTYTQSGSDKDSIGLSSLTSSSNWSKSYSGNTITLKESGKYKTYNVGYVPIIASVTVPANTSYRTTMHFNITGSPNKSSSSSTATAFVELFDLGTSNVSSGITFRTPSKDDKNKEQFSDSRTLGRDIRETKDFTSSGSVPIIFENTSSTEKTISHYLGFFAGCRYGSKYTHQVEAKCALSFDKLVDCDTVAPIINYSNGDARYIIYHRSALSSVIKSFSKEQFYPDVPSSSLTRKDFDAMGGSVDPYDDRDLELYRYTWDQKFKLSSNTDKLVFAINKSGSESQGKLAYVPFTVPIKVPAHTERTYYLTFEISYNRGTGSGAGFFAELIEGGVPNSFNTAASASMTGNTKLRVYSDSGGKTKIFSGTVTLPLTLKNDTDSAKTMYGNYVYFVGYCHVGVYNPEPNFNLTLTDIGYASYEDDYYAQINASNCTYTHNRTITPGSDYNATITANTGYSLPSTVTVKCGGTTMSTSLYTWNSSTGKLTIASKNITGGIVVTANGVPNTYSITYSGLDGASLTTKPTTHTYGTATTVGDPTKTGYTFAGWKVNGGSSATKSLSLGATAYTANISLEATWTINKYNATFSGTNTTQSSGFGTNAVTYNTAWTGKFTANTGYDLPSSITVTVSGAALTSSQYTYSKSGSTGTVTITAANVTGAVKVTAGGTAKTYSITYSGMDGATLSTKPTTHTYGTATSVGNPSKTGYTFAGWKVNGGSTATKSLSLGATAYTANIALEATWTVNKYNATLSGTNVTASTGFGTSMVTYNTAWTGKFTANTGYDLPTSVTVTVGGVTLTSSKYTYSKSGSTGTVTITAANVTGAVSVTAGGTAKKYSATLSGSNVSTSSGFGTSSVTYNTAWTGKFTANTGYTLPASVTVTVGGTTLASSKYTYTTSGSTGTVKISTAANVTGAVVVTASPTANSYTITYNLDGGSIASTKPTKHTYGTATTIPDPTKTGYTFAGWKVNSGTTATKSLILGATAYTADITLTATWTANTYNATLSSTSTNVTASTGFGTGTATYKTAWTGTIKAASGYVLPDTITVKVGSTTLTTSKYTYSKSTGKITITSTYVTGAITVTAEGHKHRYTSTVTTAETCTTNGVRTYTCSGCGSSYTETITKTGHSYATAWTTSATQHWHVCTKCNAAGTRSSHAWNEGVVTKEPTITSTGEKEFTCTTCSATKTETIAMLEHDHHITDEEGEWKGSDENEHWHVCGDGCGERVDHEAHTLTEIEHKDPTCTEDGYTKYECEVCKNTVTKEIEATGHDFGGEWVDDGTNHYHVCTVCNAESSMEEHKWNSGSVDTLPDCTNTGVRVYECTVCGVTKSDEIAVDDEAHDWGDWVISSQRTNTIVSVCKINPDHIRTQEIPPLTDNTFWKLEDSTEPTCAKDGAEIYECEYGQFTMMIPKIEHSPVTDERVEPTCVSTGLTEGSHCDLCGEVFIEQEIIPAPGHDWDLDNGEITTPSNCTQKGSETFLCKRCDATYTQDIPATGHTNVTDNAVAATCTETGLTPGLHCTVCEEVILEQTVIQALGHDWNGGEVTKKPVCDEEGIRTYTCTRCGETQTEDIPANGHTTVTDSAVSATCTERGKTEGSHCSVCGRIIKVQENIPALGHSWDDGEVTTPPTETEDGVRTYTCTVCGTIKTESIAMLGHTHDWDPEWHNDDDTYHWHDCLNGCSEKKDEAAHTWNDGEVTKEPTEDAEGEKTFECIVCGGTKTETIPVTGGSVTPENPDEGNISKEVKPGANVPDTKLETPIDELVEAVLTPVEQEVTKDGVDIKILLTVEDATNKVSAADRTAVEKAIGGLTNYKPGQYLDVNLFKVIDGVQNPITETKAALTITFEVPTALRGNSRTYSVIRVHGGKTTVLNDLDRDPNTVTIKTDKFSTYALTYSETTTSKPSGSGSGGSGSRPRPTTPTTPTDNNNSDSNSSDTTSSASTSGDNTSSGGNSGDNTSSGSTSGDNTSSGSTSSDNTSSGGNSGDNTSSGSTSGDNTSSGSNSGDNTSSGSTSGDNTSSGSTSGDNTSSGSTSGDNTSSGSTSGDNTSSGSTSGDNTSSGSNSGDNTSSGSTSGDNTSSGSTSGDNTSSGSTSGDNTSSGSTLDDNTSSGSNSTSDESTHIPSEGSSSEGNDNPATGVAVSFVPLAAVFAALPLIIKRRRR